MTHATDITIENMESAGKEFESLDTPGNCRLIQFDENSTEVVGGFVKDTWILIVRGNVPISNLDIKLVPEHPPKQTPEYRKIEVIGCLQLLLYQLLENMRLYLTLQV